MELTKAQSDAINVRNSSLIISAGAGSGKTAVLTERILSRICDFEDDCNINDFLIVTFTNAAAKELSDRMRKKLTDRAKLEPDNRKIAHNIALLPLAKISTINSFCYEIVRNNFQKLGLSASLRIGDEAEMDVIRNKIMNEVVEDAFENMGDDGDFLTAYETFSSAKNDGGFVDTLLSLHRIFTNIPDVPLFKKQVLDSYIEITAREEFFSTGFGKQLKDTTKAVLESNLASLSRLIDACCGDEALEGKYLPAIEQEYEFTRAALCALDEGYEKARDVFLSYKTASLSAVRNVQNPALKENIKNAKSVIASRIKELTASFYLCPVPLLKSSAEDTARVLTCLFGLVEDFDARLKKRKIQSGIIEFSDAERYALSLLVKSTEPFEVTELALGMRERFKEIYIDEYQDVNPLQDLIFKALSKTADDGEEYTRFMVGDVKQSIYRFRGASPDIFLMYRDSFCDIDKESRNRRIFMNHNFRCSRSVVDFSNFLFRKLMGEYYLKGDELIFARHEAQRVTAKTHLLLSEYDKETAGTAVSADMLEAALIADKIKEIVDNPLYRDSNGNTYSYKDVAVLARSKSALKTYESIFSQKGIPVFSDVGESFYGRNEILLCLSILESIDNPTRDIPLAGFMRSFAGGFTDDELCIIKNTFKNTRLYNAVKAYAADTEGKCNKALCEKCSGFIALVTDLREYSRGKSASSLMWRIYTSLGLLNYCVSDSFTNDPVSARRNLLKLYEMSLDFNKTSFRGVGAFVDYIRSSMEKDDIKAERITESECVRLMTVHASKGLEFPVCFVSDLARKFNKTDERQYLVFSQSSGLSCMLCDTPSLLSTDSDSNTVRITTPYKKLVAEDIDTQSGKEEVRILYVALTRARDMLFMTGVSSKKPQKLIGEAKTASFLGDYTSGTSFLSLILSCIIDDAACIPLYLAAGVDSSDDEQYMTDDLSSCFDLEWIGCEKAYELLLSDLYDLPQQRDEAEDDSIDTAYLDEIMSLASFEYKGNTQKPAKLTVSMLKKGLIDEEMSDLDVGDRDSTDEGTKISVDARGDVISLENSVQKKMPDFMKEASPESAADKGTAMHMFMQFARYDECEESDGCKKEADRLLAMGFITQKQRDMLDFAKLSRFFSSSLYGEIKRSKKVYREQRFNLEAADFGGGDGERDILVQGVIDLFFENDDGSYTVVDFKTDRVFGDSGRKTLIDRHKLQLMYYCRAVEEMTGKAVKHRYLYSFSLSEAVLV